MTARLFFAVRLLFLRRIILIALLDRIKTFMRAS